jgi:hypothetical protein
MAIAGNPAKTNPSKHLKTNKLLKLGTKADNTASIDVAKREKHIIGFRPNTSEIEPKSNILSAKVQVVIDSDKLATIGDIPNSLDKNGISGWVLYKIAKVLKPPANSARLVKRNSLVPF